MNEKISKSVKYLLHNKTPKLYKYYDMYSFAILIIYLAEKNNCNPPLSIVNTLFKPFYIKY